MIGRLAGGVLVVAVLGAAAAARQGPATTAPANTVWVTATVTDQYGKLVPNLKKEDFRVLDNGAPGAITVFQNDVLPFALVVVFDISGSMKDRIPFMRQAAEHMTEQLDRGDRMLFGSLGITSRGLGAQSISARVDSRFAANRKRLRAAIVSALNGQSERPCIFDDSGRIGRQSSFAGGGSPIWDGVACGIEAAFSDSEAPRRAVVVLTDGMDNASHVELREASKTASADGILVYAIGLSGGEGLAGSQLRKLANDTGGGYVELKEKAGFIAATDRVMEELHHQYVFGYVPPTENGKPHQIDVKVLRGGLTVRARRSYLAAPGGH